MYIIAHRVFSRFSNLETYNFSLFFPDLENRNMNFKCLSWHCYKKVDTFTVLWDWVKSLRKCGFVSSAVKEGSWNCNFYKCVLSIYYLLGNYMCSLFIHHFNHMK